MKAPQHEGAFCGPATERGLVAPVRCHTVARIGVARLAGTTEAQAPKAPSRKGPGYMEVPATLLICAGADCELGNFEPGVVISEGIHKRLVRRGDVLHGGKFGAGIGRR